MEALKLSNDLTVLTNAAAMMQDTAREVEPLVEFVMKSCKTVQTQQLDVPSEKLLRNCLDSAVALGTALEKKVIEVKNGWDNYESSVQKFVDNKVSGESEFKEVSDCLNDALISCQLFGEIWTKFRKKLTEIGNLAQNVIEELTGKLETTKEQKSKAESTRATAGAVGVGGGVVAGVATVAALAALCLFSGGLAVPFVAAGAAGAAGVAAVAGVAGVAGAAAGVAGTTVWANKRKEVAKFDQLLNDFKDQLENMQQLSSSINDMKGSSADFSKVPNQLKDSLRAALNHLKESRQKEEEVLQLTKEKQELNREIERANDKARRAEEENELLRRMMSDMMKK